MRLRMRMSTIHCRLHTRMMTTAHRISTKVTQVDRSGHLNCHHVFSGMPTVMTLSEAPDLPAFESSISLLITLFVPEQPRRPPRA